MNEQQKLYKKASDFYEKGFYKESSSIFTQLVLQEPFEQSFWEGLAASRQMECKYEDALYAWSLVALLSEKDPIPHFHAAECLFALHDPEEAEKALRLAEKRAKNQASLFEEIKKLREYYAAAY